MSPIAANTEVHPAEPSVGPAVCHSRRVLQPLGRRKQLVAIGWGGVLAVGVSLPLFAGGALWLLDWVTGLRTPLVPIGAFGLSGGLVSGIPFAIFTNWLVLALGTAGTWIPLIVFFPLAAWGMARLVGGSRWCRLGAATLYCVNPFVFQRIYVGDLALLLGYALLPFAFISALRFVKSGAWWMATPALWWAVLTALSPHFAWIYGVVLVVVWLTHSPIQLAAIRRLASVVTTFALFSTYFLLPYTATQLPIATRTSSDLALYRTVGDPHLGLFANVLGLYGFWRLGPGPQLPKDVVSGWPFLLLALLVVAGVGVTSRLRAHNNSAPTEGEETPTRRTPAALLLIGVIGYFLALGDQGPTGPLFRWAYFHVPFFAVMREPQKFLMLTVMAYSVFFGWGVERLVGPIRRFRLDARTAGAATLAVLLPLAYTPTIFDGLSGQITPSYLPPSWQAADRLMGDGAGQVLFLPWHLYSAFPFTDGRVIASPAPTSFRRSVISGDNVQAGGVETASTSPRSAYLTSLFAQGPNIYDFGSLIAPLGVEYVILAKAVDWRSYTWITGQRDLKLVADSASLEVWRNTSYVGVGQSSSRRVIQQISPVAYAIGAGQPGWVSLDASYQRGWMLDGQSARHSAEGTLLFRVGSEGGVARFTPWGPTRLGYIVSGTAFVMLSCLILVQRARGFYRRKRGNTPPRRFARGLWKPALHRNPGRRLEAGNDQLAMIGRRE